MSVAHLFVVSQKLIDDVENLLHDCILTHVIFSLQQLWSNDAIGTNARYLLRRVDSAWAFDSRFPSDDGCNRMVVLAILHYGQLDSWALNMAQVD